MEVVQKEEGPRMARSDWRVEVNDAGHAEEEGNYGDGGMVACCRDCIHKVDMGRDRSVGKCLVASKELPSLGYLRNVDNSDSGHHWERY
jgi:hypothetical protein